MQAHSNIHVNNKKKFLNIYSLDSSKKNKNEIWKENHDIHDINFKPLTPSRILQSLYRWEHSLPAHATTIWKDKKIIRSVFNKSRIDPN
jgi:hypothetical protein